MSDATCKTPLAWEALVDYWAGELPSSDAEALEEHAFACDRCDRKLRAVAALVRGLSHVGRRHGGLRMTLTETLARRLADDGLQIREYHASPGQTIHCAVSREDDLIVTRFAAELGGVDRVDVSVTTEGRLIERLPDVPIDRASGQVIVADSGDAMRAWPAMTFVVRLLDLSLAEERVLGEYTFVHAGIVD